MKRCATHRAAASQASANPRLYDILRESRAARHGVRRDPMIDAGPRRNLPSPWLRTTSADRICMRREIRGGRQTVSTIGWDAARNAHTWQASTSYHDARADVVSEHNTMGEALAAADQASERRMGGIEP